MATREDCSRYGYPISWHEAWKRYPGPSHEVLVRAWTHILRREMEKQAQAQAEVQAAGQQETEHEPV